MTKIFISYRRDDGAGIAGRLRDRLVPVYGAANIFVDVDNLQVGDRFDHKLEAALISANVVIPVIGRRWVEFLGERAQSARPDYVRWEVATALQSGIAVVPVMIDGAALPDPAVLSEDLRTLPFNTGYSISHVHFDRDVADFIARLRDKWPPLTPPLVGKPRSILTWSFAPFWLAGMLALTLAGWQLVRGSVTLLEPLSVSRPSVPPKPSAPEVSIKAAPPANTAPLGDKPPPAAALIVPTVVPASPAPPTRKSYDRARDGLMRIAITANDQMTLRMARVVVRDELAAAGATYESVTASASHLLDLAVDDSQVNDSQQVSSVCGGLMFLRSIRYSIVELAGGGTIATGALSGYACYSTGKPAEELATLAAKGALVRLAKDLTLKIRLVR